MNSLAVTAALELMDRHITALNAGDEDQLAATLHFPHFRLSGSTLTTWDTSDTHLVDFHGRAGANWSYSRFADIQVLQASEDKVHLDAEIRRYRADDTLITKFRSLWVIVQIDNVWAAKFRSSFADR